MPGGLGKYILAWIPENIKFFNKKNKRSKVINLIAKRMKMLAESKCPGTIFLIVHL